MAVIRENAIVQHASGTAANWTSEDPTLDEGEWGYETDTGYLKIGDGSTAWTSLGYTFGATSATVSTYSTGWVNISDWTNVELTATHSLTANLSDLIVKFFISSDGTEANAFEMIGEGYDRVAGANQTLGVKIEQVSTAAVKLQTGTEGIYTLDGSGNLVVIDSENWYYKIKIYKLA